MCHRVGGKANIYTYKRRWLYLTCGWCCRNYTWRRRTSAGRASTRQTACGARLTRCRVSGARGPCFTTAWRTQRVTLRNTPARWGAAGGGWAWPCSPCLFPVSGCIHPCAPVIGVQCGAGSVEGGIALLPSYCPRLPGRNSVGRGSVTVRRRRGCRARCAGRSSPRDLTRARPPRPWLTVITLDTISIFITFSNPVS